MTQATQITALATQIGADMKSVLGKIGDLTSLSTTAKTNLVAAINEVLAAVGQSGAQINDSAGNGATTVTWSADKIYDSLEAAKQAMKDDILGGAGAAYDTLKELQDLIVADQSSLVALTTAVNNRVRYDSAQTLSAAQQLQACNNIGIGDPTTDFVAAYTAAKA